MKTLITKIISFFILIAVLYILALFFIPGFSDKIGEKLGTTKINNIILNKKTEVDSVATQDFNKNNLENIGEKGTKLKNDVIEGVHSIKSGIDSVRKTASGAVQTYNDVKNTIEQTQKDIEEAKKSIDETTKRIKTVTDTVSKVNDFVGSGFLNN